MFHIRPLLFVALIAPLAVGASDAPQAEARPLRVLTYNIHRALGKDGQYDLARIASVINAANPDLVSLQEVHQGTDVAGPGDMQMVELAQMTGMTGRFVKAMNRHGGQVGNVVLYNPEFEQVQIQRHDLPNPDDGLPRAVMEVRLRFDDDGTSRQFDFFATHFDHASGANRNAQMSFVNDLVAQSNMPAILAGDFNFEGGTPAYNKLMREWIDPTAANPGKAKQIDYVVYRGEDQWRVVQEGRFIVNATTNVASDHHPVLAVLELAPYSADFNGDGTVDGSDFLAWQRNVGKTGPLAVGDANHDRAVNQDDLGIWKQQLSGGAGQAAPSAAPIPEPTTLGLCGATAVAIIAMRRRRFAKP